MASFSRLPGFGFHPTDEELVAYYLKRKVHGHKIEHDIIPEVDLYKCEPWDLPDKIFLQSKNLQWHFFSPRDRKYPNGSRTNRATEAGYWKATGKDRKVTSQRSTIGTKKTLVFHMGRAPFGERTDWVMHEYRIDEKECQAAGLQDSFVLCRVVKKNGLGTKSDDQSVAPTEKNDSDGANNNTLPGNPAETFCTGHQSPVLQEGENKSNLKLPSEASYENLSDMNGESIERWLDVLLDDPDQNCSITSPAELTNNAKVDTAQEIQEVISSPLNWVQDFDWIPAGVDFNMPGDLEHLQFSNTLETFEEAEIIEEIFHTAQASQADNIEANSLLLSDYLDEILGGEELRDEYHDTSMVQTGNHTNPEGTGIQLRQRSQICQQELPYEGTAMKRVRLQKYPVQHSAVEHQCTAYSENDCIYDIQEQHILLDSFNRQNHNSKNMTLLQDPVPLASARQIDAIREGHSPYHLRGPLANESLGKNHRKAHSGRGVGSSFSRDNCQPGTSSMGFRQANEYKFNFPLHDSVMEGELSANFPLHDSVMEGELSANEFEVLPNSSDLADKVTVNHVISSMPPQSLTYGLFLNSQSSEIVDIPAEPPNQTMKIEPGNSLEIWKSQQQVLTSLTEDKMPISKINCQTSLSEDGQLSAVAVIKKHEFVPSEDDSETPVQFGEPIKGSSSGEVPDSSGASYKVVHPEKILPAPSSSEPTSVRGWKISERILKFCSSIPSYAAPVMEYLGRFNPKKAILPSEFACNFGPTDGATDSAGNMGTCMCTEGNIERARSNIFLSQLKQRVKPKVKKVMPDSGEESGDAMQMFCHRCADQSNSATLHGLEPPSGVLNGFSEFWSRCAPTSSTSVIVSVCFLGTTSLLFLFLLFRAIWRFSRRVYPHSFSRGERLSSNM